MSSNSGSVAAVAAVNGECCLINHRPCLIAPQRACEIFRPLSAMTFQDGREIFRHLGALPFLGPHRFSPAGCPGRGGGDRGGGRRGAQRHRDNPGWLMSGSALKTLTLQPSLPSAREDTLETTTPTPCLKVCFAGSGLVLFVSFHRHRRLP